jgi:hypothetical protein
MRGFTEMSEGVFDFGAPEVDCDTPLYVYYDGEKEK